MNKKNLPLAIICLMLLNVLYFMAGCDVDKNNPQAEKIKFPEKPINYWVPMAAGSSMDTISRSLAEGAQKELNQPLMVINKPGASGATAMKEFVGVKADGYTLMTQTSAVVTHKLIGNLDVNHHDYEIIIANNYDPCSIVVPVNKQWKSTQEFVAAAKHNRLKVATTAKGGIWNIAALAFEKEFDVKFDILALGGGSPEGLTMAAGGHIDAVFCSPNDAYAQVKAGNVKILAVMGDERVPAFADVPTLKEQGSNIKITTTRCVFAPKGTSKEVLNILRLAFLKGANDPKYIGFLQNNGSMALALNHEAAMRHFDEQEKFYAKVLTDAGLAK